MKQLNSSTTQNSRRKLLKGAVVGAAGATGLAAAGVALLSKSGVSAHAAAATTTSGCITPIADIFTIARTAERLAVTFYSNGLNNAGRLGISGDDLQYIRAALIEEQIHEFFFRDAGGKYLASTFSFPHGAETFEDLNLFIATQQQLEGVFDSAFLSAVREFGQQGRSDLAQIAAQIACIESEHRALGRAIGGLVPADNWAFAPVLVEKVGDAPALVAKAGYLSPKDGNSYSYSPVNTEDDGIIYRTPFSVACK